MDPKNIVKKNVTLPPPPSGGWFPVDLRCLDPEGSSPCDLYRQTREGGHVLFARKKLPMDCQVRDRLIRDGYYYLFIQDADSPLYFESLKNTLISVVRDPNTTSQKKAEAVHASCQEILRWAFEEPRAPFIRKAEEAILPTVELIVSDDSATKHLIRLTAYDHSTYTHSTNVGIFAVALAKIFYGASVLKQVECLGAGFFLHDLGKCRVPIEILNKQEKLTPEEWQVIRRHPEYGQNMLEESGILTEEAKIIALQHHEKADGNGYPHGLRGNDIHPYARICRLADVYEALTADRPYHNRHSTFDAFKIMHKQFDTDLDRKLFELFIQLFSA